MSPTLVVARRELREHRFLILTALVLGVVPITVHALPALVSGQREVMETVALILGAAFAPAVALGLGATVVAPDAASGRLRFYFSRPLSAAALWAGKFLAATALVVLAYVCTALPGWALFEGDLARAIGPLRVLLAGSLFLLGAGHVASTLYRVRSRWLLLDLVAAGAVLTLFIVLVRRLALAGAERVLFLAVPFILLAGALVMLSAAAAQLVVGRADAQRGHAALSVTLWGLSCAVLAGMWGFGSWVLAVSPAQLGVGNPTLLAPRGPGLMFAPSVWEGRLGYAPMFLMNLETGAWASTSAEHLSDVTFSDDGRKAAWVTQALPRSVPHLAMARFDAGAPTVEEWPLEHGTTWGRVLAVDSNGPRAVLATENAIGLVDTSSGRVTRTMDLQPRAAEFRSDGTVRVYAQEGGDGAVTALVVFDWNTTTGARSEKLRVPAEGHIFVWDHAGDHAVVLLGVPRLVPGAVRHWTVIDVARQTSHPVPWGFPPRLLSSGNLVMMAGASAGSPGTLLVQSPEGKTVLSMPAQSGWGNGLVENESGQLLVGVFDFGRLGERRTLVLDIASGRVLREEQGVLPAANWAGMPEPGSPGAQLRVGSDGSLIRIRPDGTRVVLVAGQE